MKLKILTTILLSTLINIAAFSSYIPKLYLSGYGGRDDWAALGKIDVLLPIYTTNQDLFYGYINGRYGYEQPDWASNTYSGSLGLGYRQITTIFNYTNILGAYFLADISRTATGHTLTDISPGFESLGKIWDVRLNGYIPIGKTDWTTEDWADKFGNNKYISYQGHNQYDAWFIYHEETGPGLDAEVGRNLLVINDMLLKGFVNGYYYHMQHNNDYMGAGAELAFYPSSYLEVSANYTYDKYRHSIVMAGLKLSVNDLITNVNGSAYHNNTNLQHRLFDPIARNFAAISSGSTIPNVGGPKYNNPIITYHNPANNNPSHKTQPYNPNFHGHSALEKTNIWFFSGSGSNDKVMLATTDTSSADGTYEHPFGSANLNQATLNTIKTQTNGNASLYFNPGTYTSSSNSALVLLGTMGIYGRMGADNGFQTPATNNNRPLIIGALELAGNNTLDSIRLQNREHMFSTAIKVDPNTNVTLNNMSLGLTGSEAADNSANTYQTAITANNATVNINNSNIYANALGNGPDINATGILLTNGAKLNINNSQIISSANEKLEMDSNTANAYGIRADGKAETININNSTITVQAAGGYVTSGNAYGVLIDSNYSAAKDNYITGNNITLNNSTIRTSGKSTRGNISGNSFGVAIGNNEIESQNVYITDNNITINNSSIEAMATGTQSETGDAFGVLLGFHTAITAEVTIDNNLLNIDHSSIYAGGNSIFYEGGSGFSITLGGATATGTVTTNIGADSKTKNTINITNSSITAYGSGVYHGVGNAYGILVGTNLIFANSKLNVNSNSITLANNNIRTLAVSSDGGEASIGIALGSLLTENGSANQVANNVITAYDNNLYVGISSSGPVNGTAWGIWLQPVTGGGNNQLLGNPETHQTVDKANKFFAASFVGNSTAPIHYANGTTGGAWQ